MTPDVILFWILSAVVLISAITVVLVKNPIYSALALAMTMVTLSAVFVTLGAYFIAGVQLVVYAGAVMILFVMVLMLFDLKQEIQAFSRGQISGAVKICTVGMLGGLIVGSVILTSGTLLQGPPSPMSMYGGDTTKELGKLLFSKYLLGFEVLGVLLLIVAVGSVALARSYGGTHAKS